MSISIEHINNNIFLINRAVITVYRDMDNNVVTNPIIEPVELNILREFITALPNSVKESIG